MAFTFLNNPDYVECYNHEGIIFYQPTELYGYHKSREMAMQVQDRYSQCGITKELLGKFADTMLDFANKQNNTDTLKTDIGVLANNLKYRMSNQLDEMCALRMGALAVFMEGENPDEVKEFWTNQKLELARTNEKVYDFFLSTGIAFTPEYNNLYRTLQAKDYFSEREMSLRGLTPVSTPTT